MNTSKFSAAFFALFFVLISFTNAELEFTNPPPRGHESDTETQPPCGGFNAVNTASIVQFPITGSQATVDFDDGDGVMVLNYAPTSDGPFKAVSDNATVFVPKDTDRYVTVAVDLSKAGAKSGDQGVLQAVYTGKTQMWYQCADIKVVDAKGSSSTPSPSSPSSPSSPLSPLSPSSPSSTPSTSSSSSTKSTSSASSIGTSEVAFFTIILVSFIMAL